MMMMMMMMIIINDDDIDNHDDNDDNIDDVEDVYCTGAQTDLISLLNAALSGGGTSPNADPYTDPSQTSISIVESWNPISVSNMTLCMILYIWMLEYARVREIIDLEWKF